MTTAAMLTACSDPLPTDVRAPQKLTPGHLMAALVTPGDGGTVTSPVVAIDNRPGEQIDVHVSGDFACYMDYQGLTSQVRHYSFSSGSSAAVPPSPVNRDLLCDVNGGRVVFARVLSDRTTTMLFDIVASTLVEVDPLPGAARFSNGIGGNTIAFRDLIGGQPLKVADPANPLVAQVIATAVTSGQKVGVSPDGNVVVWEQTDPLVPNGQCETNCVIMKAMRNGGAWTAPHVVAGNPANVRWPDTDGTHIAWQQEVGGEWDIHFQNLAGGPVTQLNISGSDEAPSIHQGVIAFRNFDAATHVAEVLVYVIASNLLFRVTDTPSVDEFQPDVSVLPDGSIRVVWSVEDLPIPRPENDVYATTFSPGATPQTIVTFLHGMGATNNPPVLSLDDVAPTATVPKYRDSPSVQFGGGNPWIEVGTWTSDPPLVAQPLIGIGKMTLWLGLKNSDDIGTRFDVRAEALRNGVTFASGESWCIPGIARNPNLAKPVTIGFNPFTAVPFNGTDVFEVRVLTRIGTDGAGAHCGGHSNAVGLRVYFDATTRPAALSVTY
jgi:hypothetical protein